MQFQENNLYSMIFGTKQHFRIPDFQRAYSWDKRMWGTLWSDILRQYVIHDDLIKSGISPDKIQEGLAIRPSHYLGALVTTSGSAMTPPPSDVLDGQQRLLTSSILYLALRDALMSSLVPSSKMTPDATELIEDFRLAFFNHSSEDKSKFRVYPQDVDRAAWEYLLSTTRPIGLVQRKHSPLISGQSDRIIEAFNYFFKEITRTSLTGSSIRDHEFAEDRYPLNLLTLRSVIETRLMVVRLLCAPGDDANAIFESLNAKSEPLKQVDLIKNYIYISLPQEEASEVYRESWRPMEQLVGSDRVERFVWAVVVSTGNTTLQKRTYETVRNLLAPKQSSAVKAWVEMLRLEAKHYKSIVDPSTEIHKGIQGALFAVRAAGGSTMEPILLYAYRQWSLGKASEVEFIEAIKSIESYLVRRMLAGKKTNLLNPMVTSMINRLTSEEKEFSATGYLVNDIRRVLSSPDFDWPDRDGLIKGIATDNFYNSQKSEQRQHILQSLDRFMNKTGVQPNYESSDKSIEHILSQSAVSGSGSKSSEKDLKQLQERLHSLSNLCLLPIPVNSSIGNSAWVEKREIYRESPYALTKAIDEIWGNRDDWGLRELDERADILATIADRIWPRILVEPHHVQVATDSPIIGEIVDDYDSGEEVVSLDDE